MKTKNLSIPKLAPSQLVTDEYHGIKVEDHYRNLENLEDTSTLGEICNLASS